MIAEIAHLHGTPLETNEDTVLETPVQMTRATEDAHTALDIRPIDVPSTAISCRTSNPLQDKRALLLLLFSFFRVILEL